MITCSCFWTILISDYHWFSVFVPFFSYFFRYFFIIFICNCFWIILLWVFETFVILSAILLPIKSLVPSAVLNASTVNCLAWSRSFWLFLSLKSYWYFWQYLYLYFSKRHKSIAFYNYSISSLNLISHQFSYFTL